MRRWICLLGLALLGACVDGPYGYGYLASPADYAEYGPYYYGYPGVAPYYPGPNVYGYSGRAVLGAPRGFHPPFDYRSGYGYRTPSYDHAPAPSYGRAARPAGRPSR